MQAAGRLVSWSSGHCCKVIVLRRLFPWGCLYSPHWELKRFTVYSAAISMRCEMFIRNRIPYEQGIHVFAQPVIGPAGNLTAYSLAVTSTTSLAFSNGVPGNGDARELYRSTTLLYVPIQSTACDGRGGSARIGQETISSGQIIRSLTIKGRWLWSTFCHEPL